jgi:transcriptional regulator with XRE-family HTH domain
MTPAQCRAARGLLDWTQDDLAAKSRASVVTVRNFENEKSTPQTGTMVLLEQAFAEAGVEFIDENGGGPGVRLKAERITFEQDDRSADVIDWMDHGRFYAHWRGNRIAVQVQAVAIDDAAGLTKALPQERSRAFQDHLAEFQAYAADFIQQNHVSDGDLVDIDRVHFQQWQERKRIGR